jgi:hypothetical protein
MNDFDRLLTECAEDLRAAIEAEAPELCPDFAAVLEEAAARGLIDSPLDLRLAQGDTPQPLPLAPPLLPGDPLGDLIHEAKRAALADTAARALLALPPAPTPQRRPVWLGALLAVAAVCLLYVGLTPLLAQPTLHSGAPNQAEWRDLARPAESPVPNLEPIAPAPTSARRPAPVPPPSDAQDLLQQPPEAAPPLTDAASSAEEPAQAAATAEDDPIAALERAAEARWSAGDLDGAERHLREIIRRARSPRQRDLAYGDLFTITRQLHGRDAEAALWGEYLDRLPRGRYADDARAGLCRRDPEPAACWRRYLLEHPRGAHRDEAERAAAARGP